MTLVQNVSLFRLPLSLLTIRIHTCGCCGSTVSMYISSCSRGYEELENDVSIMFVCCLATYLATCSVMLLQFYLKK